MNSNNRHFRNWVEVADSAEKNKNKIKQKKHSSQRLYGTRGKRKNYPADGRDKIQTTNGKDKHVRCDGRTQQGEIESREYEIESTSRSRTAKGNKKKENFALAA